MPISLKARKTYGYTRAILFLGILFLTNCATEMPSCAPPASAGDVVYVVEQGWHAELGIPVRLLDKNMAFVRKVFPGATILMVGYGKKTFFTAPAGTISEYFIGPVPGPAVVHMVGLRVTPLEAYPPEDTITLTLPPGGRKALSKFIWDDLTKDDAGRPVVVAPSTEPDGLFYASQSEYNLFHTCNTWTADALHPAGLPISGDGVIFAHQTMNQVAAAAEHSCETLR